PASDAGRTGWRLCRLGPTAGSPDRTSPRRAASAARPSKVGPHREAAKHIFIIFAEQQEEARFGADRVRDDRIVSAKHPLELIIRAAHVPVAGDQPDRAEMMAAKPAQRLFRIRPGVDRFGAEIDTALDQPG